MAYPSGATQRMAFHYLIYGDAWKSFINGSNPSEGDLSASNNIEVSAPLILLWTGQARVVNGQTLSWASPGLRQFSDISGAFTVYRWARTVNQNGDGTSPDEPIRQLGDGTDDPSSCWFEVNAWGAALPEGGWGGQEVTLTVHDPVGIHTGIFQRGRLISIYSEEYEDGVLVSAREQFSGFVLETQNDDTLTPKSYTIRAGSIEKLFLQQGNDTGAMIFMDQAYTTTTSAYSPFTGAVPPAGGLVAANFKHIYFNLTPGKVINHLLYWHMYVRVGITDYRLAEVVDFRRDYWNDIPEGDATIPALGLREGNLMGQLAGLLPQGVFVGYCDYRSGFVITADHEFKASQDATLDSIDMDTVYGVRDMPGIDNAYDQVLLAQAPSTQTDLVTPAKIFAYPVSAGGSANVYQPPFPYLVTNDAGGTALAQGILRKLNSQSRKQVHVPGAKWDLHNIASIGGARYTVERVQHQYDDENLGAHETIFIARRLWA